MSKWFVRASDGEFHAYPEGYTVVIVGDWVEILDEHGGHVAFFFRPLYASKQ